MNPVLAVTAYTRSGFFSLHLVPFTFASWRLRRMHVEGAVCPNGAPFDVWKVSSAWLHDGLQAG